MVFSFKYFKLIAPLAAPKNSLFPVLLGGKTDSALYAGFTDSNILHLIGK